MNRAEVYKFAKALGLGRIDQHKRSGWVIAACPFARLDHEKQQDKNPSFALRYGKRRTFCNCFSCGFSGDFEDLLYRLAVRYRGNNVAADRIEAARQHLSDKPVLSIGPDDEEELLDDPFEWPEWYIAGFQPAYDHPYLKERDGGPIPKAVAKLMDFRVDKQRKRIGVPIRDFDGALMGFHGRTLTGATPKYLAYVYNEHYNRTIWLGEHWVDLSKPVLIAESVFDLARCLQVYRNSICPLMANFPKPKVERLSAALQVVCMLDDDKAGALGVAKLKKFLPDTNFVFPGLAGYKDVGEMPVHTLAGLLKSYIQLDPIS